MNIIVTGASGSLGSEICRKLSLNNNNNIIALYNNNYPTTLTNISNIQIINNNLTNLECLPKKCDYFIHAAALTPASGEYSLFDYYNNNVNAFNNILKYCENSNVKFFANFSSVSVYNHTDICVSENSPLLPETYYGFSKLLVEELLINYKYYNKFKFINLRLSSVLCKNSKNTFIPNLVIDIKKNNKATLTKRNALFNNVVYVDTLIHILEYWLFNKNMYNSTFNVASMNPITLNKLVRIICRYFNIDNIELIVNKNNKRKPFSINNLKLLNSYPFLDSTEAAIYKYLNVL